MAAFSRVNGDTGRFANSDGRGCRVLFRKRAPGRRLRQLPDRAGFHTSIKAPLSLKKTPGAFPGIIKIPWESPRGMISSVATVPAEPSLDLQDPF
jgi:hypothetical protein